jgi:hypothetical protein
LLYVVGFEVGNRGISFYFGKQKEIMFEKTTSTIIKSGRSKPTKSFSSISCHYHLKQRQQSPTLTMKIDNTQNENTS